MKTSKNCKKIISMHRLWYIFTTWELKLRQAFGTFNWPKTSYPTQRICCQSLYHLCFFQYKGIFFFHTNIVRDDERERLNIGIVIFTHDVDSIAINIDSKALNDYSRRCINITFAITKRWSLAVYTLENYTVSRTINKYYHEQEGVYCA